MKRFQRVGLAVYRRRVGRRFLWSCILRELRAMRPMSARVARPAPPLVEFPLLLLYNGQAVEMGIETDPALPCS